MHAGTPSSHAASCWHCLAPLKPGRASQIAHKPMEQRGLLQDPAHAGSLPQPHNCMMLRGPPPKTRPCKIPYRGTGSLIVISQVNSVTEQLSTCLETFGQTVLKAKFSFFVQAGTPWGLAQFLDQCRKIWQITSLRRSDPISEYWLNKCHLTFAKKQKQVQTQVSMKKTFLLPSSAAEG